MVDAPTFLSRMDRVLLECSPSITDIGERRRARLLAALELVQLVQFIVCGVVTLLTEHGEGGIGMTIALFATVPCTLVTYLLTRSRHARAGILAHVVLNMALSPVILIVDRTSPDGFMFFAFMLPSLMIANVATSARTTLIAGAGGLATLIAAAKRFGPPDWADDVRHGVIFLSVTLTLMVVFGLHRDRLEADRSAELRTRNEELEGLRRTLERRVAERTQELTRRAAELRLVLDNVAEGLFVVDRDGAFSSDPSAAFTSRFGYPSRGESFVSFLGRRAPEYQAAAELAWSQVAEGLLPLAVTLDQVPTHLTVDGRYYSIAFEPIGDDEEKLLVVVSDITSTVGHEKALQERRESLSVFEHIIADRAHFLASFDEVSALVGRVLDPDAPAAMFGRDLHTLKGNALLLGLDSVGTLCHDLESRVAETHSLPNLTERGPLEARWRALESEVDRLVGDRRRSIELTLEQHRALERAIRDGRPHDDLLRIVLDLELEPVEPRLRSFAEQAHRIAARLGKDVTVEIQNDDDLRVDGSKWAPLWAALIHAVRNAVDHGIEAPSERLAAGKSTSGHVTLRAARREGAITIEVHDDGRGIDWDGIRERAAARGADVDTREAIKASLFAGGVSTASEVTDLSGRGIGMSALYAAIRELGGSVDLDSRPGRGTELRLHVPTSTAIRPSLRPLAA